MPLEAWAPAQLQGIRPKVLEGLSAPSRANVYNEAKRLRASHTKAELRKLAALLGVEGNSKTVTRVVERYYRGVPTKTEE